MSVRNALLFPVRLLNNLFLCGLLIGVVSSLFIYHEGISVPSGMWFMSGALLISWAVIRAAAGTSYDFDRLGRVSKVLVVSGPIFVVVTFFISMGYMLVSDAAANAETKQKPPYVEPFYANANFDRSIYDVVVAEGPYPIEGTNTGLLRVQKIHEPRTKYTLIVGLPCPVVPGASLQMRLIQSLYIDDGVWSNTTDQWSPILPPGFCGS